MMDAHVLGVHALLMMTATRTMVSATLSHTGTVHVSARGDSGESLREACQ